MTAWAAAYTAAYDKAQAADHELLSAIVARCHELDSAGAHCTADGGTSHEHRYRAEDLPGFDPIEI